MKLKCGNCEYVWDYGGRNPYFATCPFCLRKVKVSKMVAYDRRDEKNPRWNGGLSGGYVKDKATLCLIENNRKIDICEKCGTTEGLIDIHHKDKNRKNNTTDNLIVLCRHCHLIAHGDLEGAKKLSCFYCGKVIRRTRTKMRTNNYFCSKECFNAKLKEGDYRPQPKKKINCGICGKEVITSRSGRFCEDCQRVKLRKANRDNYYKRKALKDAGLLHEISYWAKYKKLCIDCQRPFANANPIKTRCRKCTEKYMGIGKDWRIETPKKPQPDSQNFHIIKKEVK